MKLVQVFLLAVSLAGGLCAQARSKVELAGPKLPPKAKNCNVEFFSLKAPDKPHEVVAHIRVYITRNKVMSNRREDSVDKAKPELQKQACKVGADAVVIGEPVVSNSNEAQTLYVKGEALQYKP